MFRKFFWLIIGIPIAVVLIVFSVVNRHAVRLRLDPFSAENPALALDLPFFVYLFAAVLAGMALGGLLVWRSQARFRRAARAEKQRADALERQLGAARSLPAPTSSRAA